MRRDPAHPAVVLRFAGLYGPGRVVRRALVEQGEPIPGDPDKLLNLIHIDDAADAVVRPRSLDPLDSLYLVSDDRPVTRREYYSLARIAPGAPAPRLVPAAAGSLDAGRDATSKRVVNHRMKAGLGVELIYPDITTGLPAALLQGAGETRIELAFNRSAPARRSSAWGPWRFRDAGRRRRR